MKSTEIDQSDGGPVRAALRDLGEDRTRSSIALGLVSMATSAGCALLGARLAAEMFGPPELGPAEDVVGNAIRFMPALLYLAIGGLLGFIVGVTVLPSVLMWASGWSHVALTTLTVIGLEILLAPIAIWMANRVEDTSTSSLVQVLVVVILGGAAPAAARRIAISTAS